MSDSGTVTRRLGVEAIRRTIAWHPEWWVVALSLVAWYFMLAPPAFLGGEICGIPPSTGNPWRVDGWSHGSYAWLVMVVAMMLPLVLFPIRATAFNSLWRRRHWAIGTFLLSYLAVWMVAGGVVRLVAMRWQGFPTANSSWLVAGGLLVLCGWQLTVSKQKLSVACHRSMPLAPAGWRAHCSCLCFGASQGFYCVGNCGALMLLCLLSPWPQPMMLAAAVLLYYERYRSRPRHRTIALAFGLLALAHVIGAVNSPLA